MNIIVEQWMDKLAIVEKLEKAGDTAQISRNLNERERTTQMSICRKQLTREREEMDRMADRMTEEQREEAGRWYDRHIIEDRPGLYLG
jgi:hypothetical protein